MSGSWRRASRWALAASLSAATGCTRGASPQPDLEGEEWPRPEGELGDEVFVFLDGPARRQLDLVFVVNDAAGMGREQAALSDAFDSLWAELSGREIGVDLRVAVTNTDISLPRCASQGARVLDGRFDATSCLDRAELFTTLAGDEDEFARACSDRCSLTSAELGLGGSAWLEADASGGTNLAPGVSVAEAFACIAPQGVRGCGFEAPLEAMHRVLLGFEDPESPQYGFRRPDAALAFVVVTDEDDCSFNPDDASVFDETGGQVFWPPNGDSATSAVCWNAGARCEGPLDDLACELVNRRADGTVIAPLSIDNESEAVLWPVARYVRGFDNYFDGLDSTVPRGVFIFDGVGFDGEARYRGDVGPAYILQYGIGPGCEASATPSGPAGDACTTDSECSVPLEVCGDQGRCAARELAYPPLRLRAFLDAIESQGAEHTVCVEDFAPGLASTLDLMPAGNAHLCYPGPLFDADEATPGLQPSCIVAASDAPNFWGQPQSLASAELAECQLDPAGGYQLDADGHPIAPEPGASCFAYRADAGGLTANPGDDPTEACAEYEIEIEIEIDRRAQAARDLVAVAICRVG